MQTLQERPAPVAVHQEVSPARRDDYPTPENYVRPKVFAIMAAISVAWGGFMYVSVNAAMQAFGNHW